MTGFNLTKDPWIQVYNNEAETEELVSLRTLFANAQKYAQLAGDTPSQDLAVFRLLLAILTTVYSRYDAHDQSYAWLQLNDQMQVQNDLRKGDSWEADLTTTWEELYAQGHFSSVVTDYLDQWQEQFEFLKSGTGFYQVTEDEYNNEVETKSKITPQRVEAKKGTVAVKQLDRRVSESGNSVAIFASKQGEFKERIELPELIRWIIAYQNYTGISDKAKVALKEKRSGSSGWLYRMNPIVIKGKNLFETLMYNLVLIPQGDESSILQKPVWEYTHKADYIDKVKEATAIDNLAELYTLWSRILHIKWEDVDRPIIFNAVLPMPETSEARIEPMTSWRTNKSGDHFPAAYRQNDLTRSMVNDLAMYLPIAPDPEEKEQDAPWLPGTLLWLRQLDKAGKFKPSVDSFTLANVGLLSDGKPTSQMPAGDRYQELDLSWDMFLGRNDWPQHFQQVTALNNDCNRLYWGLVDNLNTFNYMQRGSDFVNSHMSDYNAAVSKELEAWLDDTVFDDDEWVNRLDAWKETLYCLTEAHAQELMRQAGPQVYRPYADSGAKTKEEIKNANSVYGWFTLNLAELMGYEQPTITNQKTEVMSLLKSMVTVILNETFGAFGQDQPFVVNLSQATALNEPQFVDLVELVSSIKDRYEEKYPALTKLNGEHVNDAIFHALRWWAIQQQAVKTWNVNGTSDSNTLFQSLRKLMNVKESRIELTQLVSRLESERQVTITERDLNELIHFMSRKYRAVMTGATFKVNYAQLAVDWYCLLQGGRNAQAVYEKWGAEFFKRFPKKTEEETE